MGRKPCLSLVTSNTLWDTNTNAVRTAVGWIAVVPGVVDTLIVGVGTLEASKAAAGTVMGRSRSAISCT